MPMVLITPQMDNKYAGKETYVNGKSSLSGFRLSHQGSQYGGLGDYGFFSLMPVNEGYNGTPQYGLIQEGNFKTADEKANAYEYQVTFNNGINTELTSTRRSGYFVFKNPNGHIQVILSLPTTHSTTGAERKNGSDGSALTWDKENLASFSGYTDSGRNKGEGTDNYGLPNHFIPKLLQDASFSEIDKASMLGRDVRHSHSTSNIPNDAVKPYLLALWERCEWPPFASKDFEMDGHSCRPFP